MSILGEGKLFKDNIEAEDLKEEVWWDQYFFSKQLTLDDFNPDELIASKGARIYDKMMIDEQVKAAYEFIVSIIISRNWRFENNSDDPQQEEIKLFLEWNVNQSIDSTFKQALKSILLSKAHGYSLSERTFKVSEWEGRKVWSIKSIKPKYFDSFELQRDAFGNLNKIFQIHNGSRQEYDLNQFIYHINFPEYEPVYGVSDLRAAYKAYWQKSVVEKFWAVYMERMAGGAVIVRPGENAVALEPNERNDLKNVLRNLSNSPGIITPKGYDLEMIFPNSTTAFENYISQKDRQIARALLMPSLSGLTEQQNQGSQALATVQEQFFFAILANQAEQLAETLNEQLFSDLVFWNFGTRDFPRFKFDPFTEQQKQDLASSWREAVKDGSVVNTFEDESRTRDLLSYPQREKIEQDENPGVAEDSVGQDGKGGASPNPDGSTSAFADNDSNINVEAQKKSLDKLELRFKKKLSSNLLSIIRSVISNTREFLQVHKVDPSSLDEQFSRIDNFIPEEKSKEFKNSTETILNSAYKDGRNIAKKEIRRLNPNPVNFSERGILPFKDFNVECFIDGLTLEKVESILSAEAFNITGILEGDILKVARQAIIDGIQNDLSITAIINNLRKMLGPIIGGTIIDPKTGRVIFDLEDQARLETISRTNINNVFNQAKISVYTDPALDNFVKAFEYSAILDTRTTDFCRKFDGFIRSTKDPIWREITPPNHFNCRSTLIPITEFDDFSITANLPKTKGALTQPNTGFGIISEKNEK